MIRDITFIVLGDKHGKRDRITFARWTYRNKFKTEINVANNTLRYYHLFYQTKLIHKEVISTISHEEIHAIIWKLTNYKFSKMFDNISGTNVKVNGV